MTGRLTRRERSPVRPLRAIGGSVLVLIALACGDRTPPGDTATAEPPQDAAPAAPAADMPQFAPELEVDLSRMTRTPSGLYVQDIQEGSGAVAEAGREVSVHYTGRFPDGRTFDSSRDRGAPHAFRLGTGAVIAGWDEGVAGMKVGGRRKLVIPPALAYGEQGHAGGIPPNTTLVFDVELMEVR